MSKTISAQVLEARANNYQFQSDLGTEMALKWSLPKHEHLLTKLVSGCRWCGIERMVIKHGHMASVEKAPEWWKRFIAEWQKDHTFGG